MRYTTFATIAALAFGCAETVQFRPTENVTAEGHGGQPAAGYDVRLGPDRDPHVHVNVWSQGAYVTDNQTIVHLTVGIRNTGDQPVYLDSRALHLEAFTNEGRPVAAPQLVYVSAPDRRLAVLPGDASTMELRFALPRDLDPEAIGSLRLRWAVEHDDGRRYVQFTEFQRVREQYAAAPGFFYYDPVFGYYDPFFYGPPYGYHFRHHVPVQRVIVDQRDRGGAVRTVRRDR